MTTRDKNPRQTLRHLFKVAVGSVIADRVLPDFLPLRPKGRTIILAIGKGASSMASVVARHWNHDYTGLIVTRYGHYDKCDESLKHFEIIEASHPVPDERGIAAGKRVLEMVSGLDQDDMVLVLISGGGSALLPAPVRGIDLEDKIIMTHALLASGARIDEINCVRKHLSRIKGGRLAAAAAPAKVVTLAIADVVGNHPGHIASGPTVADNSSLAEAQAVIKRYNIDAPDKVMKALRDVKNETPRLDGAAYQRNIYQVVAAPQDALCAARSQAMEYDYKVDMLGDLIEGEAKEVAAAHADIIRQAARDKSPTIILSGGEVTVTLSQDHGIGGPNTEYLLALAIALDGMEGVYAIACDTDGKDGAGDNAGAIIGPTTLARARKLGLDPAGSLAAHDSYNFFKSLDDLVITGPTNTNVNDFRAILLTG